MRAAGRRLPNQTVAGDLAYRAPWIHRKTALRPNYLLLTYKNVLAALCTANRHCMWLPDFLPEAERTVRHS